MLATPFCSVVKYWPVYDFLGNLHRVTFGFDEIYTSVMHSKGVNNIAWYHNLNLGIFVRHNSLRGRSQYIKRDPWRAAGPPRSTDDDDLWKCVYSRARSRSSLSYTALRASVAGTHMSYVHRTVVRIVLARWMMVSVYSIGQMVQLACPLMVMLTFYLIIRVMDLKEWLHFTATAFL